jgi:DNA/RNA endonuclease YhcR with UshA esterase domain
MMVGMQFGVASLLLAATIAAADCIPMEKARDHIGENVCVTGKVLGVREARGVRFLNFCEDYRICPFTVVVFNRDLRDVGDIYQLKDRNIEIHGAVKLYDDRPEIILRRPRQLTGASAHIAALPKDFDVERKGRYSAGQFKHPTSQHKTARKGRASDKQAPPDWPDDAD